MKAVALGGCLVLLATACGSSPSVSQYADDLNVWARDVDSRLDAGSAEFSAQPVTVDGTREYLESRVALYVEAIATYSALEPPNELAELDAALRDWLDGLLAAEQQRADLVASIEDLDELARLWDGPATQAVLDAEGKGVLLCHAAQQEFDATGDRGALSETPWIPPEMREVVSVALGCPE